MKIMNQEHPRWGEFMQKLEQAVTPDGENITGCQHDHAHCRRILTEMGGVDIEKTIKSFESHGGYCDCEVILNVEVE